MEPGGLLPHDVSEQVHGQTHADLVTAPEPVPQPVAEQLVVGLPHVGQQLHPVDGPGVDVVVVQAAHQPRLTGL